MSKSQPKPAPEPASLPESVKKTKSQSNSIDDRACAGTYFVLYL